MNMPNYTGSEPCAGIFTDLFYPEDSGAFAIAPVLRKICSSCHVLDSCAEYAIRHEAYGWWAGLSPTDRQRIRTRRGIVLKDPMYEVDRAS